MQNDDISYEQAIIENNPAEQMRKYAVALKELRHQPVDLVIERLFVQGEFNMLTERYGEHDHFYFQMFCDAWNTDEDYFWFERICIGRFILMLPHPAHAVFLLQAPDPLVPWSENAWAAAKRCGLLPYTLDKQLLISAMKKALRIEPDSAVFHGKAPLSQFLERRTETEWLSFCRGLMFLCTWWGQPGAPHLEGYDMKTATVALAKEEDKIAFRNNAYEEDLLVLGTVKKYFANYGAHIFGVADSCDFACILQAFAELVIHCPNLKWRLARILHEAAAKEGLSAEVIEAWRYKLRRSQYKQNYFTLKRRRMTANQQRHHAEKRCKILIPFQLDPEILQMTNKNQCSQCSLWGHGVSAR